MTLLGLPWQAWLLLAVVALFVRAWWRAVRDEYTASRRAPASPPVVDPPAAPAACLHHRVVDVVSGTLGTVVAMLCLDCDEQLTVPERAVGVSRCAARNLSLNLRCDRDADHEGTHWRDNGNGLRVWGWEVPNRMSKRQAEGVTER